MTAYAKSTNLLCFKKRNLTVILKNEADINKSKDRILTIPNIKIINIKYRDEQWSRMVNKMDLPNMENPFKNEFVIKVSKNTNINEVFKQLKEMSFVEDVKFVSDTKCTEK